MGICYNIANFYGGGCLDPEVGLTRAGRRLVEEVHKQKILLDHVRGFESMSELPDFVKGLIQRGWPTGDIRKVLGGNWLRVYENAWGA